MAKKKFTKKSKEIEVDQFLSSMPESQWPDTVVKNSDSATGYYYTTVVEFDKSGNKIIGQSEIKDTDYLIYTGPVPYRMNAEKFEQTYTECRLVNNK